MINSNSKKSIGIFQETINNAGGGELVCLSIIEILVKEGIDVTLITTEKTDWQKILNAFGIQRFQNHFNEIVIPLNNSPRIFGIYYKLLAEFYITVRFGRKFNLFITCIGAFIPFSSEIIYLHHSKFLLLLETFSKQPIFRKLYLTPYIAIKKFQYKRLFSKSKIFCNSRYFLNLLKSHYPQCDGNILYPPIDVKKFRSKVKNNNFLVITCSRFVPQKNLDIIPTIASTTPNIQYHIIGSTNKNSKDVLLKINSKIQSLNCKNVFLHTDMKQEELLEWYQNGSIYLHTAMNEDFGISTVEGMSSGLIPVVFRSGGPFSDIIDEGKYGFSYEKPEEAGKIIDSLLKDQETRMKFSQLAINRSSFFSKENFQQEILKAVLQKLA